MTAIPVVTIAVCTCDRHDFLRGCVEAILAQETPGVVFEILIVDNSADRAAAEAFYRTWSLPAPVRLLWSAPPGLSRARNIALQATAARYVIFLDDDALPQPGWLGALLRGFQADPRIAVVGGPVEPIWPTERPKWLSPRLNGYLTVSNWSGADRTFDRHDHLFGTNIAFDRAVALECGGFSERIGRQGAASLLSSEDTQIQDAIRARGHQVRYVAAAGIRHHVHADRLSRNWFRSRMAWQAVSDLLQEPPAFDLDREARRLARQALRNPDLAAALRVLFQAEATDQRALLVQLRLIRSMVGVLLAARQVPDDALEMACDPISERHGAPGRAGAWRRLTGWMRRR